MSEIIELIEKEVEPIEKQEAPKSTNSIAISDAGELFASTDVELIKAVGRYRKMGLVPQQLDTDAKAAGAILYAKQLGFNPLSVWGQIACIHGKFCCFGSLFTSLAKRDPEFGEDQVFFLDVEQKQISMENKNLDKDVWACVVRTRKKGSQVWNEFFFTVDDAKAAGIFRNVWTKYTKDMLFFKTIARAYKFAYPLSLQGVQMAEDLNILKERDAVNHIDLNTI